MYLQGVLTTNGRKIGRLLLLSIMVPALHNAPAHARAETPLQAIVWTSSQCEAPTGRPPVAPTGIGAALLGVILPGLVEGGISFVGNAIARAGAPRDIHVWGQEALSLYSVRYGSPSAGTYAEIPEVSLTRTCVAAAFGPARPGASFNNMAQLPPLEEGTGNDAANVLSSTVRTRLDSQIDLTRSTIFVGQLEMSPDQSAFRIVPRYVEIAGALRDRRMTRERGVAITVSFLPPMGELGGAASATRTFSFPNVSTSRTMTEVQLASHASSWMPLPGVSDITEKRLKDANTRRVDANALTDLVAAPTNDTARERAQRELTRLNGFIDADTNFLQQVAPYTIRVDMNETTPGSPFLVRLGEFLSGNAEELAAPIVQRLDPTQRAAAAETGASEEDELRIAVINETAALAAARAESNQSAIRVAEIKAAAACRRLSAAGFADVACIS